MSENNQTTEEVKPRKELSREDLEAMVKGEKNTPEDVAAAFFTLEQPRLKVCIDKMSQNEMRRLLYNLVSYPLIKPGQELKSDLEKTAFYLANQMIENKQTMRLALELQKAEEAYQKQEQDKLQTTITEEKAPE